MMDKYKQQEEVNADLLRQIELLEEQGDTAAFAEEMKKIYSDRDSYGNGPKASARAIECVQQNLGSLCLPRSLA